MTECQEVGESMAAFLKRHGLDLHGISMDKARRIVRKLMPNESVVVVDNAAEALWWQARESK